MNPWDAAELNFDARRFSGVARLVPAAESGAVSARDAAAPHLRRAAIARCSKTHWPAIG